MNTPIADFVRDYAASGVHRLHMPGHKGRRFLGCEHLDITEITGADNLGHPEGMIRESEENAAALFGSGQTLYSTGGSSLCVRAMLHLALTCRAPGTSPTVVAARNVHQSFVYGLALSGGEPLWLWPEAPTSLCSCPISPEQLEKTLASLPAPPAAVFVTSPDYLGGIQPIKELARVAHKYHTPLLVDNAHGAYLRFLAPSRHPMDLGADLCCDSAHKTLPVLTGGAYLHIGKNAPAPFHQRARQAMAVFATTSPSYLIMQSLDLCNRYLSEDYPSDLAATVARLDGLKVRLRDKGWAISGDPLRLTVCAAAHGLSGEDLAARLRSAHVEWEMADLSHLVLMVSPQNSEADFQAVEDGLGLPPCPAKPYIPHLPGKAERAVPLATALFAPREEVPLHQAAGRICASPVVGFPPAVPLAVSGERLDEKTLRLLEEYGFPRLSVMQLSMEQYG